MVCETLGFEMSRTNVIALLIFGAILGYFLSFGPETTQKFKAGVYRLLAPFLTGGSGIKKQITSVRSGLKSLDQLEHETATLQVENRELRATLRVGGEPLPLIAGRETQLKPTCRW